MVEYGAEGMLGGAFEIYKPKYASLWRLFVIIPSGAGQYSDIAYMDATTTPNASDSRTVDMNSNGTYLASGYAWSSSNT